MQFTANHSAIKRRLFLFFQILVTLSCLYWISQQVTVSAFDDIKIREHGNVLYVLLILLLMPLNWMMEIQKWYLLRSDDTNQSFAKASKQVLDGLLMSWIIPFTLGDVVGRIQSDQHKTGALKSLAWNRFFSLVISLGFGSWGLVQFFLPDTQPTLLLSSLSVILVIIFLWLWRDHRLYSKVFYWTLLRYLVMAAQLYFSLSLFIEISDPLWVFAGVTWIFLFRSIIPSIWGALGVREMSAILFFTCCYFNEQIISSTALIWVINLVVPSLFFGIFKLYLLIFKQTAK